MRGKAILLLLAIAPACKDTSGPQGPAGTGGSGTAGVGGVFGGGAGGSAGGKAGNAAGGTAGGNAGSQSGGHAGGGSGQGQAGHSSGGGGGSPGAGRGGGGASGTGGVGGTGGFGGGAGGAGGAGGDAPPLVPAFATQALAIAAEYTSYGRVDDELRWAPFLCRIPLPGITRPSKAGDGTPHGQKLYSVFAKNHAAYPEGPQTDQVVVKQSWTAQLVDTPDAGFAPAEAHFAPDAGDHFYGYAKGDGGVYRAAGFAGLYIMFRLAPGTPGTDQGWVYATVTADEQVTAAGAVPSCMGCHESATHERLFGVPLSPSQP